MKCHRLDLFKEIPVGFTTVSRQIFPTVSFIKLVYAAINLAFKFIFSVARIFVGIFLSYVQHIIIKGIAIRCVKWSDNRDDLVAEIFSQPRLGSPACVACRRVLLPDVGSSSSHFLYSSKNYLTRHLMYRLPCWVWGHVGQ